MKPKEVVEFAKKNDVKFVDLKFIDFPGIWQHTTVPANRLTEACFEEGSDSTARRSADGSHQRLRHAHRPRSETAKLDPFTAHTTLSVICSVSDPITGQPYSRDPRFVAKKAEAYLRQSGIGDAVFFGPEAEFFVFDHVRYDSGPQGSMYAIDSEEAGWNSGKEGDNLGYKIRNKEGYFPFPRRTRSPPPSGDDAHAPSVGRGSRGRAPRGRERPGSARSAASSRVSCHVPIS
jgi:glutamine synthetase